MNLLDRLNLNTNTKRFLTIISCVLILGIGIGIPLLSRIQTQDLKAAVPLIQQQNQQNVPAQINNYILPTLTCSPSQANATVGEQVLFTSNADAFPVNSGTSYLWVDKDQNTVIGTDKTGIKAFNTTGTHNIGFTLYYNSGNTVVAKQASCSVSVQGTPAGPTLFCSSVPHNPQVGQQVDFSFNTNAFPVNNNTTSYLWVDVDHNTVIGSEITAKKTYNTAGNHNVSIAVNYDTINGTVSKHAFCPVNVTALAPSGDTTVPVIQGVTLSTHTPTVGSSINVAVTATDNVGVASVTVNGAPLAQSGNVWAGSITALAGTNTVTVIAYDAAHNQSLVNNSQSYAATATPPPGTPTLSCAASPQQVYIGDTVTWTAQSSNFGNSVTYTWSNAVTGQGISLTQSYSTSGAYNASVHGSDGVNSLDASCSVLVSDISQPNYNNNNNNQYIPPPNTGTGTGQPAGNQPVDLTPALDIISCKAINSTIILDEGQLSIMRCYLKPPALVTAWIIKGDYTPPKDPDVSSILKTLLYQKTFYDQSLSINWNGSDSYDNLVPDGDYSFVVTARKTAGDKPDISLQKVHVLGTRPPQTQQIGAEPQQPQQTAPQAPTATPPAPPKPPEPSKCPSLNYPSDIESHWAKNFIRQMYDNCIFKGYPDGTFRPDRPISRVEAVKVALLSAGIPPKLGCYTTDCGSPFKDLSTWHGQWVRAAWDKKIVVGISKTKFSPNGQTTRGQAIVLIAKAFGIQPHKGCYTPNCGAGYPNNFFLDINDMVLGSYLRAMWDLGLIRGTGPNAFDPNRPITRAEMASLLIKTAIKLGRIKAELGNVNQPAPQQPIQTPATQEPTTMQQIGK